MRLKIQKATANHIVGEGAIREFIYYCIHGLKLGLGFHVDTSFGYYEYTATGKKCFTKQEADELDNTLNECDIEADKLGLDIYMIGMEIMQPLIDQLSKDE